MDFITIVIPTYQRPRLLGLAIQSVLSQSYPHFQLKIYDNASGDDTGSVVKKFMVDDPRISYHVHETNIGMMANYKFAISKIETPYFVFLSDDDLIFPSFLQDAIDRIEKDPSLSFVAGSALIMDEKGKVIRVPLELWEREGKFLEGEGALEMVGKFPIPSCILFRRDCLKNIQIDDHNPLVWDCDFLLQTALRHPFYVIKKPSGIFLRHSNSFSSIQKIESWIEGMEKMICKLKKMEQIDVKLLDKLENSLSHDLKNLIRGYLIYCLTEQKYEELWKISGHFLARYKTDFNFLVLLFSGFFSEKSKLFRGLIRYLKRTKHYLKDKAVKNEYGAYSTWFKNQHLRSP